MGNGARNRAKRREAAEQKAQADVLTEALLEELFAIVDAASLKRLLSRQPALLDTEVEEQLRTLGAVDGYGATFERFAELLSRARTDPDAAWNEYARAKARVDALVQELDGIEDKIAAARESGAFDEAITVIEEAIPKANEAGLGALTEMLLAQLGLAYLNRTSSNRSEDLEIAREAFEAARELTVDDELAANHLMHLGLVWGERVRGDRGENLEQAIHLLEGALEQLTPSSPPDLRAMMLTNLAQALMRSEREDRVETLRDAAQLCMTALQYRSPERSGVDWAYSQLNLGEVLEELADRGEVDAGEAVEAYDRVIQEERRIQEKWLVGSAHHSLGAFHLKAARVSAEDLLDAHENSERQSQLQRERARSLETARQHLQVASRLTRTCPDPIRRGRVLADLSEVLTDLDADDQAIGVAREALRILRPNAAPRWCVSVGGRLGDLLAQRSEWAEAAAAFQDAVEAAEFNFHARLDTASREEEARRAGNLSRWAAFAIARSGDPVGAALALENGRARELRRRLGLEGVEEAQLAELPPDLREAYMAAVESIAVSPMGPAGGTAARQLQEILEVIRGIPGFDAFATGARPDNFAGAFEPGWPLVYVNPTPYGTLLLRLHLGATGLSVQPAFLSDLTAIDVFMRLMIGDAADLDAPEKGEKFSSYLFGISGQGDANRDFRADLDEILPWLGRTVAQPLHELLADAGAAGVTLVPCGPVGVAPLHAASWVDNGENRCLLDVFDVRYAPSAVLAAASGARAARRTTSEPNLAAVGDPTGDLAAARPEVEEVALQFPQHRVECAFGSHADRRFLQRHAPDATYLHLACHSRGGLFDADDAAVLLADGPASANDLTALAGLETRLVAVSSCQSALPEIADLPDEVFSIGTAMLACGSACAIASLWSVHDVATSLLMTRLYEEMLVHGHRPPEALRRAQLWLRDLTPDAESAFLDAHPALRAEFQRRVAENDRPGLRRSPGAGSNADGPYSHPAFWAAFIAMGV